MYINFVQYLLLPLGDLEITLTNPKAQKNIVFQLNLWERGNISKNPPVSLKKLHWEGTRYKQDT